jgi:predicted RND superfamily exporter protein
MVPSLMIERLARALTRLSVDRPYLVTVVFLVLFAVGGLLAQRLELRLNYMELLPEDAPEVVDLKWVMKKAGTEGYLVLEVSGGTREDRLEVAPHLAEAVEALPEVRYAEFRYDVPFFRQNLGSFIEMDDLVHLRKELDEKVKAGLEDSFDLGLDDEKPKTKIDNAAVDREIAKIESKIPSEFIEDATQDRLYLLAKPALASMSMTEVGRMLANVEKAAKVTVSATGKPLTVAFGGPAVFTKALNDGVTKDLGVISAVALTAAALLLLLATRRPLAALFVLLPIAGAIACALGMAALTIGHLNIISSLLVAILLGLGVEFGIHLILRTSEARTTLPLREALLEAVPETMDGAFTGAVTNAAAFGVLLFASFSAYRQFGGIAAAGILMSWLFTYSLLPALIVGTERFFPESVIRKRAERPSRYHFPRWFLWTCVVALPLFAAFGAWATPHVPLERSFNALNGDSVPDPVGVRASAAMKSTLTPAFIWVEGLEQARRVEEIFAELKRADKNPQGSIIDSTLSLARVIRDDWGPRREELRAIRKDLRRLPDDLRDKHRARLDDFEIATEAEPLRLDNLPEQLRRKFTPLDGHGTFVLFIPSRSVDDSRELDDFVDKLELAVRRAEKEGIETRVMSENRIAVHIFRQVFADAPFIGWSATLVALAVLFLLLKNVKETLVVFAPLALGMLSMVALMYLFGVKLNFINMCVIPSIFTIAIDNTVHLYHRYVKEGPRALPQILANTGLAVLLASMVNASGYVPMLLADFYGLKSLGFLASFGMLGMVLATVGWFPALLALLPEGYLHAPPSPAPSERGTDVGAEA